MKWFICFYILPAIISAWLLPQFLEYQHMNDDENLYIDEIQYKFLFRYATLTPIINLITAILLVRWSVLPR
jgi:phosphatidylglycerophosphatase A